MDAIPNHADTAEPTARKTVVEDVYLALRQEVLDGDLEPGSRMRTDELRQRFGVSTSTVREALSRLLIENLATIEGHRGFRVAPVSIADFHQIAEMRQLLEGEAIRQSILNGDEEWEASVVAAAHRLSKVEQALKNDRTASLSEWEARNGAFHDALVAACTNRWLLSFRQTLYRHSVRYIRMALVDRRSDRDVHSEHQAILEATLDRDVDRAVQLTRDHIGRSVTVLEH